MILVDGEEGHLFPTFGLARELRKQGHSIHYLGFPAAERIVTSQGFPFTFLLEDLLPAGTTASAFRAPAPAMFDALANGGALDRAVRAFKPDLFLTLSVFSIEALVLKFRYNVPAILLRCHWSPSRRADATRSLVCLRCSALGLVATEFLGVLKLAGVPATGLGDVADLILRMPEIVLLPKELENPDGGEDQNVVYGGGVDTKRSEESLGWREADPSCKLIYCSLGSQADLRPALTRAFFQTVVAAAAARPDLQFVVSTGMGGDPEDYRPATSNVYLTRWAPQMEVLAKSALMITHGGFSSIRECIFAGVPMIVAPVTRDQFDGADLAVRRGLAVRAEVKSVSAEKLCHLIDTVLGDPGIVDRVRAMRECFRGSSLDAPVAAIEAGIGAGKRAARAVIPSCGRELSDREPRGGESRIVYTPLPPSAPIGISLVIPTRNRSQALGRALAGLRSQNVGFPWELIVVDNGSTDDTARLLASFERVLPLKVLYEPRAGKSRALNLALEAVRGDLVVFTDDDVSVSLLFLSEMERAARWHPDAAVFCGPIVPEFPAGTPLWLQNHRFASPAFARFMPRRTEGVLPPPAIPFGPNFAVRRGEIGDMRFRVDLGPSEEGNLLAEDIEFAGRFRDRSAKFIYLPNASVTHHIRPELVSIPSLFERAFNVGRSVVRAFGHFEPVDAGLSDLDPAVRHFDVGCALNVYFGYLFEYAANGSAAHHGKILAAIHSLNWSGDRSQLAASTAAWLRAHPAFDPAPRFDQTLWSAVSSYTLARK